MNKDHRRILDKALDRVQLRIRDNLQGPDMTLALSALATVQYQLNSGELDPSDLRAAFLPVELARKVLRKER